MRIENKPVINKQADLYALNFKFKIELEAKEEEIEYLEKQKDQMTDHIMTLEKENLQLKSLVQNMKNINPQKVENV